MRLLPECWSMIIYQLWINGCPKDVQRCSLVSLTLYHVCQHQVLRFRKLRRILWKWRSNVIEKKLQRAPKDMDESLFLSITKNHSMTSITNQFKKQAGIVMHMLMQRLEESVTPISNYFVWTLALLAIFDQLMSQFLYESDFDFIDQMFINSQEYQSLYRIIKVIQSEHRWWISLLHSFN